MLTRGTRTLIPSQQLLLALASAKNPLEYLTPNDWILLVDKAEQVTFKKGQKLLTERARVKTVYLFLKGTAVIRTTSRTVTAEIGPGEICGEMAYLETTEASADVVAEQDVEAVAIPWSVLDSLFALYPHLASRFYRSLALSLSRRLRQQISFRSPTQKPLSLR